MNTEFVLNLINTPNYPPRYPVSVSMKYGRIKRKHGRVGGLDQLLSRIVRDCPYVSRIVPGRISVEAEEPRRVSKYNMQPGPA